MALVTHGTYKHRALLAILFAVLACSLAIATPFTVAAPSRAGQGQGKREPPLRPAPGMFFALSVPDVDASTRWYSEKLGLETLDQQRGPGTRVAILEGAGLMVELLQHDKAAPRDLPAQDPSATHGLFKVGLLVDDLDEALDALRKRGVEIAFGPYPARPPQRANAIIRDNAGTLIQLFAR